METKTIIDNLYSGIMVGHVPKAFDKSDRILAILPDDTVRIYRPCMEMTRWMANTVDYGGLERVTFVRPGESITIKSYSGDDTTDQSILIQWIFWPANTTITIPGNLDPHHVMGMWLKSFDQ